MLGYTGPISGMFSFLLATSTTATKKKNYLTIEILLKLWFKLATLFLIIVTVCQFHTKDTWFSELQLCISQCGFISCDCEFVILYIKILTSNCVIIFHRNTLKFFEVTFGWSYFKSKFGIQLYCIIQCLTNLYTVTVTIRLLVQLQLPNYFYKVIWYLWLPESFGRKFRKTLNKFSEQTVHFTV